MKRQICFLILLFGVFFGISDGIVFAQGALRDDCEATNGPGTYTNLTTKNQDITGWENPPDGDYLCQKDNGKVASAVYKVQGVASVEVAIYSRYGSFSQGEGESLSRGGEGQTLDYCAANGEVYGGGRRMCYDADTGTFVFVADELPKRLVPYGLSIFWSQDGADYTRADCTPLGGQTQENAYCYETYQAQLDPAARYVKLTLTDQSSIQIVGREDRYHFTQVGGLCLASVEFEGEAVELPGDVIVPPVEVPEQVVPPPTPNEVPGVDVPAFEEELPEEKPVKEKVPPPPKEEKTETQKPKKPRPGKEKDPKTSKEEAQELEELGESEQSEDSEKSLMIIRKRPLPQSDDGPILSRKADTRTLAQRLMTPDAVTVLLISITLLVLGIRLLADGNNRR